MLALCPPQCLTKLTLVDDEAIFGQVLAGDAATVSPHQEQHLGWGLSDGLHPWLVAQIQRCNLTGHPVSQPQIHFHQSASELLIKALKSIKMTKCMQKCTQNVHRSTAMVNIMFVEYNSINNC